MSKAVDAFRTISEVAAELDVPKHVLRFWEAKFAQIRPMKRGGGRRYYRPTDMELLRGIRHLLHAEGYTIKGVQKILREQGVDAVKIFGMAEGAAPVEPEAPKATARRATKARPAMRNASNRPGEAAQVSAVQGRNGYALTHEDLDKLIRDLESIRDALRSKAIGAGEQPAARRVRAGKA